MAYAQNDLGIKLCIGILFVMADFYQQELFEQTMMYLQVGALIAILKK